MAAEPGEIQILDFSDRLHKTRAVVDEILWPLADNHWGALGRQFRFDAEPTDYVRVCRSANILGRVIYAEIEAECSKWEVDTESVTVSTSMLTVEERVDDTNREMFIEAARLSLDIFHRFLWGDAVDEPTDPDQ
jgi:hypothetical protein